MKNQLTIFQKFPRVFWIANTVELFERWAWYGFYVLIAIYLTDSRDTGALGFSSEQQGTIMGVIVGMTYFLPVFTGVISDKIGYKKSLLIAFLLYFIGLLLMGTMKTYLSVFISFGILGLGASIFKPIISATVSKTVTSKTSSIGFGIFYMMVNIGAFIGPIFSSKLREHNWVYVFYLSAGIILFNFFFVLLFYNEPDRKINNDSLLDSIKKIFNNLFEVFTNGKFILFLLLIVGFWTMYLQLFFTLPVFIEQWVDTSILYDAIASWSPYWAEKIGTDGGMISAEMITNVDALFIILFQIVISTLVMKYKPLNAMIGGVFVAAIGVGLMFIFQNPIFIIGAILIFSLGEMSSSPKITEYIGLIAPMDKKGLYMGMSFLPLAGGHFLAGYLVGKVYAPISDKISLLKNEFIKNNWEFPAEFSDSFTKNDFLKLGAEKLHTENLTDYLWNLYHPDQIWYIFSGIGMITVIGLWLYDRFILGSSSDTPQNAH